MKKAIYEKVRNTNDDLFALVARQMGLKSGDISPLQENAFDEACKAIAEVMEQWIEQNK